MPSNLSRHPIHLGRGASAVPQPEFTGDMAWYVAYDGRHGGDGPDGRLVSMYTFTSSWTTWEVHPKGDEVVICVAGEITLIQDLEGEHVHVRLGPGDYAINPPGVWHTADVEATATAVFITPGEGTLNRDRA